MRNITVNEDHTVFIPLDAGTNSGTTETEKVEKEEPLRFGGLSSQASSVQNLSLNAVPPHARISPLPNSSSDQNILLAMELNYRSGINPLIESATELFFVHYQIIKGRFSDGQKIKAFIQNAFLKFEMQSQQAVLPKSLVQSAKYVLCTFLDETVLQAEWGRNSDWGRHTLLSQFFNETWGGKTVFKIRQFCLENLHEYIDLLEMIYLCLCLGFRGQYGTEANGEVMLDRVKRETYQAILEYRGDRLNLPLSPQGISEYQGTVTLKKTRSIKWMIMGCLAVLTIAYTSMSIFISLESQPVYEKVMSLTEG